MNKHTRFSLMGLLVAIFLIVSCDWDKFTGANFSGKFQSDNIKITGTITHLFTGMPVSKAVVQLGSFVDSTDFSGRFLIMYKILGSEIRNKPVMFVVSHYGYKTFYDTLFLTLNDFNLNVKLEYVFPIIGNPGKEGNNAIVVKIVDYQGLEDLKKVLGKFLIEVPLEGEEMVLTEYVKNFYLKEKISDGEGIYKVEVPSFWFPTSPFSKNKVTIVAEDFEGHIDSFRVRLGDLF